MCSMIIQIQVDVEMADINFIDASTSTVSNVSKGDDDYRTEKLVSFVVNGTLCVIFAYITLVLAYHGWKNGRFKKKGNSDMTGGQIYITLFLSSVLCLVRIIWVMIGEFSLITNILSKATYQVVTRLEVK